MKLHRLTQDFQNKLSPQRPKKRRTPSPTRLLYLYKTTPYLIFHVRYVKFNDIVTARSKATKQSQQVWNSYTKRVSLLFSRY